jgi:hypothetical protein
MQIHSKVTDVHVINHEHQKPIWATYELQKKVL